MKKLSILFILLLFGCTPASIPTPTLVPTTSTKVSTPTLIPTPTPYPSLQTDGPYLLFQNDVQTLLMIDADGKGRKLIELPKGGRFGWDHLVSPNGRWVMYYTGTVDEEPYDLALSLLNLETNSEEFVSNLIAPGFPENLEPVTETLYFGEYDSECESNSQCKLFRVQSTFREGIWHSAAWSPDSQFIAFGAQIDGPSSDIYLYSLEDNSIRRLTNELENIWSIDWSPNGDKILYESSNRGDTYISRYIHVIDPDIKSLQNPKFIDGGAFWFSYGWLDNNSYLIYSGGEGAPPHRLRFINVDTEEITQIWEYSAESFFVDLQKNIIILSPYGRIYLDSEPEVGVYVISFDGNYHKVYDEVLYFIDGQTAVNQYIAINQQNQLVSIEIDGSITNLQRKPDYYVPPQSSPDGKWIVITNEVETEIYSQEMLLVKSLGIHAETIIWRQDSLGVFLSSYPYLYYVSMSDKESNLIDICPSNDCLFRDYVWIP